MDTVKVCQHCGKPLGSKAVHGLCPECFLKVGLGTEAASAEAGGRKSNGFAPPAPEELAPHFPQLEILELLGKGGMGAVYRARQKTLNRFVALKILPPGGGDPAFAERFTREAQALARLNHPNIVAVHDFGIVGQASSLSPTQSAEAKSETGRMPVLHYFVMEYVDGVNLRQMLRAHRLSPREAMAIVPQVCEALQYAHDHGIVHRDIKPENVLVDKIGRVKIADFGLAKLLGKEPQGEPLTRSAEVMGTPQYMAPEQLEKPLEVDHRADIYSLGVVFYEMLTGELPLGRFAAPSHKVQVDVRLDEIVLRALEKEPERRYQQASVFKTEVESIATQASNATPGDAAAVTLKARHARRVRMLIRLSLICTLTALLFLILQWFSRREPVGVWIPARVDGSIGSTAGEAVVRVTDAARDGQVVLVKCVCEAPSSDRELLVQFSGPVFEFPADLVTAVTNVDCLMSPTFVSGGGKVLAGTKSLRGKAVFQIGFVLPDAATAAKVVEHVRQSHLGKPRALTRQKSVVLLFSLHRRLGNDANGQAVTESLTGMLVWPPPEMVSRVNASSHLQELNEADRRLSQDTVRLLAVAGTAGRGVEMWQPDGTALPGTLREELSKLELRPGPGPRWFIVLVSNAPTNSILESWQAKVGSQTISRYAGRMEKSGQLDGTLVCFSASPQLWGDEEENRVAVRFGFAVRPWRSLSVWTGSPLKFVTNNWPGIDPPKEINLRRFGSQRTLGFDSEKGVFFRTNSGTEIRLDIPEAVQYGGNWRMRVTDKQGRAQEENLFSAVYSSSGDWRGGMIWHVEIERTNISTVALEGHLVEEDFHWVEFDNVALAPEWAGKNPTNSEIAAVEVTPGRPPLGYQWYKTQTNVQYVVPNAETAATVPQPTEPKAAEPAGPASDVAGIPAAERLAGGDTNKFYFLIGRTNAVAGTNAGRPLLLVLPGGDGSRDFLPFVKRIWTNALAADYLVAQLVAPKWDELQFNQLVWPTEITRYPPMRFPTEAFVRAVIADVESQVKLNPHRIFTLSWSSGGPAAYAVSLDPNSRVSGSFVAMSVFRPEQLPAITNARGRSYFLLHSPEDFIPIRMAEQARSTLLTNGAQVLLERYAGGHGWRGDVYGTIRRGMTWLEQNAADREAAAAAQAQALRERFEAARSINGSAPRDKALSAIAIDAARAGDAGLTRLALGQITMYAARDAASLNAARELVKTGHRTEAIEIVNTITSFNKRDEALRELAE